MDDNSIFEPCAIQGCNSVRCQQYDGNKAYQEDCTQSTRQEFEFQFRLMDLPVVVRERVFELCLGGRAIEFCPEPFRFEPGCNYNLHNDKQYDCRLWSAAKRYNKTKRHHGVPQYAGLLRVSKQVSKEALDVLYGQNEFRFTNVTSILALEYFLYHIGPRNIPRLRHLTILHPAFVVLPTSISNADTWWKGMHWTQVRADDRSHHGFGHGKYWWSGLQAKSATIPNWWLTESSFLALNKINNLHHLHLLIPDGSDWSTLAAPISLSRFTKLAVTFARLTAHDGPERAQESVCDLIAEYNEANGTSWLAEDLQMDKLGEYDTQMYQRYKFRA